MPPKKEKKTAKKPSNDEIENALLSYINEKNRPFSVQNMIDNLKNVYKKAGVTKALETMAEDGRIGVKEFGKAKMYFADQSQFEVPSEEESRAMDEAISEAQEKKDTLDRDRKMLEAANAALASELTNDEIVEQIAKYEADNEESSAKLTRLQDGGIMIDEEYKDRVCLQYGTMMAEWKYRRKMVMDIMGQMADSMEKKLQDLAEEAGIETDEAVNLPLKEVEVKGIPRLAQEYARRKTMAAKAVGEVEKQIEKEMEEKAEEEMKRREEEMRERMEEGGEEGMQMMGEGFEGEFYGAPDGEGFREGDERMMEEMEMMIDREEGEGDQNLQQEIPAEEEPPKKQKRAKSTSGETPKAKAKKTPKPSKKKVDIEDDDSDFDDLDG
ncbi:putative Homologous-pairing protein 2 like protein [Blattamonas nauphoetae]|uniref:Homologous-pairing protein 2 like protein n=1 Tax=Blattamonas nauphoetae TaxID=2049346 RepID=A0ABQ9X622_9EUKA|nr:putative Homologous-pairing protein 2 like protein [Blattamonas nauphoetae]